MERERQGEGVVIESKKKELESARKFGTYEEGWSSEVPEEDRDKIITTPWNIDGKDDGRTKARICLRGFQDKSEHRRDSPLHPRSAKDYS